MVGFKKKKMLVYDGKWWQDQCEPINKQIQTKISARIVVLYVRLERWWGQ